MGFKVGVTYSKDKFIASTVFVSENAASNQGILTKEGLPVILSTSQLGLVDDSYSIVFAYTYADGGILPIIVLMQMIIHPMEFIDL